MKTRGDFDRGRINSSIQRLFSGSPVKLVCCMCVRVCVCVLVCALEGLISVSLAEILVFLSEGGDGHGSEGGRAWCVGILL